MSCLSQAPPLGNLSLPHGAFQEHAAHVIEWSMTLRSKGSLGACTPKVFLHSSMPLHGAPSGATVLVVKGALYIFLALHLLRLPRRPMLQHGVKNSQQRMHARRQGDFFDFPRREEPFVKDFDLRVEARGHQRAHV